MKFNFFKKNKTEEDLRKINQKINNLDQDNQNIKMALNKIYRTLKEIESEVKNG